MVLFSFSNLDRKYLFSANFVQKTKIVNLSWNLVLWLIWICRIHWHYHFFLFSARNKYPFRKIWSKPKNHNCQFKLKFGTKTNQNMQNSLVVFTFSGLDQKYPFRVNLVQKIKIFSLSWKVTRIIWIWRILWWCVYLFCFRPEILFLGKFGP